MSAPRTKRQFAGAASDPAQRQITSFFSNNSSSSSPSSFHLNNASLRTQSDSTTVLPPVLSASVQANLLSVGMRVRKSVPEGYKTGSYSAFALWDEGHGRNNNQNAPGSGNPITSASAAGMGEGRSRANAVSAPRRELLPFCGIHKVGGLGTQPEHDGGNGYPYQPILSINDLPLDDNHMQDDDDVPGLTSSQESVASTGSDLPRDGGARSTRKRGFAEDEDGDAAAPQRYRPSLNLAAAPRFVDFDGEVSPRSLTPAGWAGNGNSDNSNNSNNNNNASTGPRAIAVPRAKLRRTGGKPSRFDQENVMMVVDADGDFDEADFLDRAAELEYRDGGAWEVEMSDV
ncbi:ribonucleotide reductase inhibitor-domain-containing protein [Durotheca rogersii]|uniref:ribonucleotide reductase inhibitor-domain-containing protein n=1 Tax=Durotheca rogersii TaxID=419775 RepID=UPI0022207135|nr:ribonucleotide reductase inhibitor-domain-containing protein [Durotheca rogersii]KAI5860690.1 ribonucleotide reductase inhibitor-domain-containing protein [Durotheca rogersii]